MTPISADPVTFTCAFSLVDREALDAWTEFGETANDASNAVDIHHPDLAVLP